MFCAISVVALLAEWNEKNYSFYSSLSKNIQQ
jgi:hypothetical protein